MLEKDNVILSSSVGYSKGIRRLQALKRICYSVFQRILITSNLGFVEFGLLIFFYCITPCQKEGYLCACGSTRICSLSIQIFTNLGVIKTTQRLTDINWKKLCQLKLRSFMWLYPLLVPAEVQRYSVSHLKFCLIFPFSH